MPNSSKNRSQTPAGAKAKKGATLDATPGAPGAPVARHKGVVTFADAIPIGTPAKLVADKLAESGLTPAHAKVLGVRALSGAELRALGGAFTNSTAQAGLYLPCHGIDGKPVTVDGEPVYRVRLLPTPKRGPKYLSQVGTPSHLYFPRTFNRWPEVADDTTVPSSSRRESSRQPRGASTGTRPSDSAASR